ncbi:MULTISPECIES: NAD(P)-dependent malic enzyme [Dictyoglomus]|uniref:Malate dehydrogenase (Oxaloacetate-decarboxylating) n=1 Tax=Dictyoglomus turgidum (strain DSM 6724 / Z-1310) TaxID=515635 RepID=B8E1B9_DICTD|nr:MULTISPECIES: malic enzyme-like NAD(P)-binding protein [Dictyoglomus]ACK42247.1 Malate dehydrogenase (oxaloacetate-decarboxylating) [Dictyoglomus turgidum DSM 6724]HBU32478.1 NAD-dependent malic enzyme [Dictyoglomus sp.]
MNIYQESIELHRKHKGKIKIDSKIALKNKYDLSLAYTPGVAGVSEEIYKNNDEVYNLTIKANTVAVISDGSAVLGLGNIGPLSAIPVMEGKALLFKRFANIDAFPICLNTQDPEKIIEITYMIAPIFGGINLEDIAAPKCFIIEERLKKILDIPVFHDDQHGTAIVVYAALINALKLVNKKIHEVKIVILGAGAAGIAITKLLLREGAKNIRILDRNGIIYPGRKENMNEIKEEIARTINPEGEKGELKDALKGADVFIGVSQANLFPPEYIRLMNKDPIIFAMANPIPEIMPEEAKKEGVKIIGTGRSDYPNQINNLLAFPGVFRGAFTVRAKEINDEMKVAAAKAIASLVEEPQEDYLIPSPLDERVVPAVSFSVAKAAIETKVAKIFKDDNKIIEDIKQALGGE